MSEIIQNNGLVSPSSVIKFDKTNHRLEKATLILKTRSGKVLGNLMYDNFKMSIVGKGLDEISFDIHKTVNGQECAFWDKLTNLSIVDYVGYGQFEASFATDIEDETIKHATCVSLETELGQRILREFHVNDDEAMSNRNESRFTATVFYNDNDKSHSLLHRVLADRAPHWRLGHIPDKLNVNGTVYPSSAFQRTYTVDGTSIYDFLTDEVCEESNCIFTFDTYNRIIHCYNIEECVYYNADYRVIDGAYRKDEIYYDKYGKELPDQNIYGHCDGIGNDTDILVSQKQLAKNFQIQSDNDTIKNCFHVSGGDDKITNAVAAVNATGQNYIYMFDNFQYEDMSDELREAFLEYTEYYQKEQKEYNRTGGVYLYNENCHYNSSTQVYTNDGSMVSDAVHDDSNKVYVLDTLAYVKTDENGNITGVYNKDDELLGEAAYVSGKYKYIEPGLYTKYCQLSDRYYYLNDSKFPDTGSATSAGEEYNKITSPLPSLSYRKLKQTIIISNEWTSASFDTVTKTIQSILSASIDTKYSVEILTDPGHPITCTANTENDSSTEEKSLTGTWTGYIRITRDAKPEDTTSTQIAIDIKYVSYSDDKDVDYVKQKLQLAIARLDIADIISHLGNNTDDSRLVEIFKQYNLTSLGYYLKSFQSCITTLQEAGKDLKNPSGTYQTMLDRYNHYVDILQGPDTDTGIIGALQKQVDSIKNDITMLSDEITAFQQKLSLQSKLGEDLYREFCAYIREDEYHNDNYISDGLSDSEILAKAKMLVEVATKELSKACVRQQVITSSLNNIFALPLYEPLFDDFAIFNYIRVRMDDNTFYKLRIVQIDFDESSPESLSVTFSENAEYIDGTINDLQSMKQQVNSIATSFSSTVQQAKQGYAAANFVDSLREEGLSAAHCLITNNANQDVVINTDGILLRPIIAPDSYGECQARLTGSGLYLTDDAWKNVKSAIGIMKFNNQLKYGVIADTIIGELIAGNNLVISNTDGKNNSTVTIDKNGLSMTNGKIELHNNTNTITIDPDDSENRLFCIKKNINNNDKYDYIFYVDRYGNAYFNGDVTATSGSIGNWKIDNDAIYRRSNTFGNASGMYFGSSGLSITDKFKVWSNGNFDIGNGKIIYDGNSLTFASDVTMNWSQITDADGIVTQITKNTVTTEYLNAKNITAGSVAAENITGTIISGKTINGGEINGSTITGGTITGGTISGGTISGTVIDTSAITINGGNGILLRSNYGGAVPEMRLVDSVGHMTILTPTGCSILGDSIVTASWSDAENGKKIIHAGTYRIPSVAFCDEKYVKVSDYRIKKNTKPLPGNIDDVFDCLRPIQYEFKDKINAWRGKHFGELAQRIDKMMKENGLNPDEYSLTGVRELDDGIGEEEYCIDGKVHYINHEEITWLCVDQIQKLKKQILQTLGYKQEIDSLKQEINDLKEVIQQLQEQN